MKVCVVANGLGSHDNGELIDACDFVVRIKAWRPSLRRGAGRWGIGQRCDAHATYAPEPCHHGRFPAPCGEHWMTQTLGQLSTHADSHARLGNLIGGATPLGIIRWVDEALWERLRERVGKDPSTGFVAVGMAMAILRPTELIVCGFDVPYGDGVAHDHTEEIRAYHDMDKRIWLGKPVNTKLTIQNSPASAAWL